LVQPQRQGNVAFVIPEEKPFGYGLLQTDEKF